MLIKRGKYWHVQLKVNGRTWKRSTNETNLARARIAERRIQMEARLRRTRPPESLSFDHAVVNELSRIETDISRSAARRADFAFAAFQDWLGRDIDLDRVTTELLERYQRHRLAIVARSTVQRELDAVHRLLRENGFAPAKPRRKPGRATEQRPFTDDELVRFFAHCPPDLQTLFLFLLATGARPAEAIPSPRSGHVALLKTELIPEENTVVIRSAKVKPGQAAGKARRVMIPEALKEMLLARLRQTPGPHIFPPEPRLCKRFDQVLVAAGIATRQSLRNKAGQIIGYQTRKTDELGRKLTAHSFRHTFATKLAQATGGDQFVLKATLGHAQISTTDRYCHITATTTLIPLPELPDAKTA